LLSVIYNPITEDFYYAEKGKGAYLNKTKLKISNKTNLSDSILVSDLTKNKQYHDEFFKMMSSLSKDVLGIRLTQSTSINLGFVAEGRYDAYIKNKINYNDIIGGTLICEEAGGMAIDFSGNGLSDSSKGIIVSNINLNNEILEKIKILKN
jgi:myo-inositol-1(or 4)-monophosphatase